MGNCCICNKKLGYFEGVLLDLELSMCEKCNMHKKTLEIESECYDKGRLNQSIDYFKEYINSDTMKEEAKPYIQALIEKAITREASLVTEESSLKSSKCNSMKITTGYNFEGYKIVDYIDVVSDEIAMGTGFLSEVSISLNDVLGTSSETYRGKIGTSKATVLSGLKEKASYMGANAIIGIDFDVMTVGKNMIVVSGNGTAVAIEKIVE
ncbi:MAG: heavy metal-binding domain-containing protein [Agathobacter sp.]|nr:heavy metal-binding domain-containing protein [Agathobacter sp.]MBQ6812099.1 heavy metal-binding domain-containing protein [Agathobacter sp.]